MAYTQAELHARYRAKVAETGARLNCYISQYAYNALKRLSAYRTTTTRATLEAIILEAERQFVETLKGREYSAYIDQPILKGKRKLRPHAEQGESMKAEAELVILQGKLEAALAQNRLQELYIARLKDQHGGTHATHKC